MKLKAIPRSRAKTSWGLVSDVVKAIEQEYKRANMHCYVDHEKPEEGGPACGTVGCFAGWVTLLAHGDKSLSQNDDFTARAILGAELNYYTVPGARYVFNGGGGDKCADTLPSTKAHARAVISRIKRFMRMNEKALKAHKLDLQGLR